MKRILTTITITLISFLLYAQPQWITYNQFFAVTDIAFDSLSNKWIATGFDGLYKFNSTTWIVFDTLNSNIPSNKIFAIAIDKKNVIWIGTDRGIGRFDGTNWSKFDSMTVRNVTGIKVDNNNIKWMSTINHGLAKYNDTNWIYFTKNNSGIQSNSLTGLDLENHIKWMATGYDGIIQFNDTNFINYNTTNSGITSNMVRSISVDYKGDKWMGFHTAFAARFDSKNNIWTYYNDVWPGLTGGNITFVYNDSRNVKWFGSNNGLFRFNDTVLVNCNPPVNDDYFGKIKEDKYKNVWFCCYYLHVYNPNGVISVENIAGIVPKDFIVHQNFPNPFNPFTNIKYQIPKSMKRETSNVKLVVFDLLGKEVATLVNEKQSPGTYEVTFDGSAISSGLYFYSLFSDGIKIETKKMILIK